LASRENDFCQKKCGPRNCRSAGQNSEPPLARIFHSRVGGREVNQRSAGFQTCRVADFQIGRVSRWRKVCGLGNPRYSRLGSLRYKFSNEISGLAPAFSVCSVYSVVVYSALSRLRCRSSASGTFLVLGRVRVAEGGERWEFQFGLFSALCPGRRTAGKQRLARPFKKGSYCLRCRALIKCRHNE
jgi:hypothetical protein